MSNWTKRALIACVGAATVVVLTAGTALADVRALWHLDETSGTTMFDSSPYANNGEIHNVTLGQPGLASGTAYGFNGVDSYVFVPDTNNSLDPVDQDITVTAYLHRPKRAHHGRQLRHSA